MQSADNSAQEIFSRSLDCDSPEKLADFLDDACGSDTTLRERVQKLLQAHSRAGDFLGGYTRAEATNTTGETKSTETQVGQYKLLEVIGEGGMGTVYMAKQTEPVNRRVALKLIKTGMDTRQVVARFEAERQALAMMDHPNIAKVLDAGATESGRPYFVMELVKGKPITNFCDEQHLDVDSRLKLFQQVCHAVQHAHQKGIIHRDIKPSNVLVAMYDDKPVPKVIDFGVAKATGDELTEKTMFTRFGQIVGTLEYMSPEQAQFNQLDIDTRSDIYSLGAILYELLAGAPPFEGEKIRNQPLDETLRMIREEEPTKPSTALSDTAKSAQVASDRKTSAEKLGTILRGDLDWIVMKALDKDRSRRYETANGLARDIGRYQNDEPVSATPPSAVYRFRKYANRNKVGLAFASVVVIFVLAGIVGLLISNNLLGKSEKETLAALRKANENQKIADKNFQEKLEANKRTETIHSFVLDRLVQSAKPSSELGSREITVRESLLNAYQLINDHFPDDPVLRSHVKAQFGQFLSSIGEYELARLALESALAVFSENLGVDNNYAIKARLDLINVFRELNDLEAGLSTALESVEITNSACGKYHRDTIRSLFRLGTIYSRSRAPDAIKTLDEAADRSREAGFSDLEALSVMELGNVYFYRRNMAEAESNWREALSKFDDSTDRSNVLLTNVNLSKLYWSTGRRSDSLSLSLDVVEGMTDVYGPEHPHTISALRDLATHQFYDNDTDSAINSFRRLVEATKAHHGPVHERTAKAMTDLGTALRSNGEFDESIDWLESALSIVRERFGENHPRTLYTLGSISQSFAKQGNYVQAAEYFQQTIDARLAILSDAPDNQSNKVSLGGAYCNYGNLLKDKLERVDKAIECYTAAIELLKPIADNKARLFLTSNYTSRAEAFAQLEDWEKAMADADRAIAQAPTDGRKTGMRLRKARLLALAGRVHECTELIDELISEPEQASDVYFAARVMALCAAKFRGPDDGNSQAAMNAHTRRCIELLYKANELDPDSVVKLASSLQTEPDFDELRELPEFRMFRDRIAVADDTTDN